MYPRFLCRLCFLFLPSTLSAQFIFQNFNQEDGLSANHVRCLYKDQEGYLWIGTTNGLNRFDGSQIRRFRSSKGEKDDFINAIYPFDDYRHLLIATSKGIKIFDKETGTFRSDKRFTVLDGKVVLAFRPDSRGRLWVIARFQLYIYTEGKLVQADSIIPALKIMGDQDFTHSGFAAFCWDAVRQGFWVGGTRSFFIDCKKDIVFSKENNPHKYPILDYSDVVSIAVDKKQNLWFSSGTELGLYFWDSTKKSVKKYSQLDGKELTDSCNRLYVDSYNRLWISTYLQAAYYKLPGHPIRKLVYDQDEPYSIGYGYFREIMEDADGNLWFGTMNGVSKHLNDEPVQAIYNLPSFKFFLEVNFAPANSITVDKNVIMAAKEEGMIAYNMEDHTFKRYAVTTDSKEYIRNKFLMSLKGKDRWWFAGYDGVYYLKHGENKIRRFDRVKPGMVSTSANFIFEDSKGKIWFQIYDDALYRYDPVSDHCDRFDGTQPERGLFTYAFCKAFIKLKNGNLLFTINGVGFLKFDAVTEKFSIVPVADARKFDVAKMVEDAQGNIWSAVWGKGIVKLTESGADLDSLNTSHGLLFDHIVGLCIDKRGFIWAASNEGLMFFDPATKAVTEVKVQFGKTLQDFWKDVIIDGDKVYAVMMDQVVVFNPAHFLAVPIKKPPHITYAKIFGKQASHIREITDFNDIATLTLSPHQDFITFQFASLNHKDVPSLQYSYQLVGSDQGWINAGRLTTVSYNNLTPRTYIFKVRSTDEKGRWMDDVTALRIRVLPQWWQRWWFLLIVAILSVTFLMLIFQSYRRRKQKSAFARTINYFANSTYGENSVNEICWDIARNCISHLHFEDCVVYLLDKEKNKLVQKAAYGPKNIKGNEITNPLEIEMGQGIVGTAAATKRPLIIPDTTKDPRYIVDDYRRFSELSVPILHEGRVIGVVDSEHRQKDFFTMEHARTLQTIASISANKIAEAQAEKQAQDKEIMLLEINKMLAESQLMALRAQMNPHFVFNCLNSIQECIITEKYGEASDYLGKFSKLFRNVLNNSDKNLVTIEEEEDVLELYLQLEQMRFGRTFDYQITTDDDLESEDILLPSMLLQPYVENALWHGLMHKNGKRDLLIAFKRINDEVFECRIEDNGIGRKQSFEIKKTNINAKRHKSKGMQISKDRLNLLQRQGQHASVDIIDKYSPEGDPRGTLVVIRLSTFLQNT
jgi:ligand-binding sensor domain-containing protein/putative methionine-R-sulfoxide reductase with GAF domain